MTIRLDCHGLLVLLVLSQLLLCHGFVAFSSREQSRWTPSFAATSSSSFDDLFKLEQRLQVLELTAPESLVDFYEPHLYSFSLKPGSVSRLSVTSTCYALLAILANPTLYDSFVQFGDTQEPKRIPLRQLLHNLIDSEWRQEDLFQTSILLFTLLKVDTDRSIFEIVDAEEATRIRELLSTVFEARTKRRLGSSQTFSDYICFQLCQVYTLLHDTTIHNNTDGRGIGDLPLKVLPEGAPLELSLALSRSAEVGFNELCRQLAYKTAGDTSNFDIMRLAYSLLSYLKATKTLTGTAGRELVPGQGPAAGTEVVPLNRPLVTAALKAFFDEQRRDGLWDQGQPIYKSFRRQGRNVGNAFVFSVDTVASLLEALPPESFRPHLNKLQKTLEWIEAHQTVEVIPDYCDVESGQCYGKPLRGWSSPHLSPGTGPQAWSTAQVITCISRMRSTIRKLLHKDVLEEFNGIALSQKGPRPESWNRLLDSDISVGGSEGCTSIKCVLESRVCLPFSDSVRSPSYGAAYSTILFGPPGTAKTTICESLAERMGWDFVVIDTAAFLADGLTNVAARIRYVFTRLQALEKCVILFDEIEEFCLDRETPGLSMESRMLTTAMLTAINDLRRTKRSVFFVATNRLRAFDSAVIRPGRFDMQLFTGVPNLESRVILLEQALVGVPEEARQKALDTYRSFLESKWSTEHDTMFMNFLESKQFADNAAKSVIKGGELQTKDLDAILKQQAAVMTVRGSVRDEYIASMELSRL